METEVTQDGVPINDVAAIAINITPKGTTVTLEVYTTENIIETEHCKIMPVPVPKGLPKIVNPKERESFLRGYMFAFGENK